tara:strand:- start:781 stop:972 length:192 start_codon:yes stop_codon:yes gene_type:complete
MDDKVLCITKAGLLDDLKEKMMKGEIRPSVARKIMELIVDCKEPEQVVALRMTTLNNKEWGEA